MRTRTRAVQIFNMSLIDILCGALGAFCFMMLVLLPYYKPPASAPDLHKQETDVQELLKELQRLKDAAKDSALVQQMTETMRLLEDTLKQMQGRLNQLTAENETLKAQNQSLTEKNLEQTLALSARRPFVALVSAASQQAIELYLQKEGAVIVGLQSNPPFDPALPLQPTFSEGDVKTYAPGSTVWMVRDIAPNARYKVYVKLVAANAAARFAARVEGFVAGENWSLELPRVMLVTPRFWELMGTLTGDADGKFSFKPATQEERDAEWRKLSKEAPPSAQPSATAQMSAEERRAWLEKIDKMRQQQQRQLPGASPSAQPSGTAQMPAQERGASLEDKMRGMSPEDRKSFIERLRQQQQRQSAPAAGPSESP